MEGILLILLVLVLVGCGRYCNTPGRRGGIIVKDNPASKKPKIGAAPQGIKPKKIRKNKKI